jgi:hypothetical protein
MGRYFNVRQPRSSFSHQRGECAEKRGSTPPLECLWAAQSKTRKKKVERETGVDLAGTKHRVEFRYRFAKPAA